MLFLCTPTQPQVGFCHDPINNNTLMYLLQIYYYKCMMHCHVLNLWFCCFICSFRIKLFNRLNIVKLLKEIYLLCCSFLSLIHLALTVYFMTIVTPLSLFYLYNAKVTSLAMNYWKKVWKKIVFFLYKWLFVVPFHRQFG